MLAHRLTDEFPGSAHVHDLGLGSSEDRIVWEHARSHGFTIVTKDSDFLDLALTKGTPPQVIWLRPGNCKTSAAEALLRANVEALRELDSDPNTAILTLLAADAPS